MEFLNLGWSEILLILLVAFVILGPDKLTKTGHDIGAGCAN
jgi:Sec-independent protein translocase protein TatA